MDRGRSFWFFLSARRPPVMYVAPTTTSTELNEPNVKESQAAETEDSIPPRLEPCSDVLQRLRTGRQRLERWDRAASSGGEAKHLSDELVLHSDIALLHPSN
jgi:hypothetical protein